VPFTIFFGVAVLAFGLDFGGVDLTSAALAREAAVPCNNLEFEADKVDRVGVDLTPEDTGLGLGLPEDNLARAEAVEPVARPVDELSRRSCALPLEGVRVFARYEAVGFEGVPVSWGLNGAGSGCERCDDDVRRAGPVKAGVRRGVRAGGDLAAGAGVVTLATLGDLVADVVACGPAPFPFSSVGNFGPRVEDLAEGLIRDWEVDADGVRTDGADLPAGVDVDDFGVLVGVEVAFCGRDFAGV